MALLFELEPNPGIAVVDREARFPVNRIFCVGRNYEAHAAEMGSEVDREAPFYFTKPASAATPSDTTIPYPPGTHNFHYEMELVVALGAPAFRVAPEAAMEAVWGYAAGLDMTRRDLQAHARERGRPWDLGKAFEHSAIVSQITPAGDFGALADQEISLRQNGELRQQATLSDMVWRVPELIADLSRYYHLVPGDLIFTGTPAGVGAVAVGDVLVGEIAGLAPVRLTIGPAE